MTEDMRGSHSWEDCCTEGDSGTEAYTSLVEAGFCLELKQNVYAIWFISKKINEIDLHLGINA